MVYGQQNKELVRWVMQAIVFFCCYGMTINTSEALSPHSNLHHGDVLGGSILPEEEGRLKLRELLNKIENPQRWNALRQISAINHFVRTYPALAEEALRFVVDLLERIDSEEKWLPIVFAYTNIISAYPYELQHTFSSKDSSQEYPGYGPQTNQEKLISLIRESHPNIEVIRIRPNAEYTLWRMIRGQSINQIFQQLDENLPFPQMRQLILRAIKSTERKVSRYRRQPQRIPITPQVSTEVTTTRRSVTVEDVIAKIERRLRSIVIESSL